MGTEIHTLGEHKSMHMRRLKYIRKCICKGGGEYIHMDGHKYINNGEIHM